MASAMVLEKIVYEVSCSRPVMIAKKYHYLTRVFSQEDMKREMTSGGVDAFL
ncbi:MAG TPA: hypothetical protein VKZ54_02160 [Membranihabitans sp.]|nr:hypothetical protein [Membranihabitans sp.]